MALRRIIAVCVVRNGAAILQQTLDAIASQSLAVDLTAVVDLGSNDNSIELIQQANPNLGFQLPVGTRFSDAVDTALERIRGLDTEVLGEAGAAEAAQDDWVWVLSQDNTPDPDALRRLIHEAEVSPSVGVVGPKLVRPNDRARIVESGQTLTVTGATVHLAAGELDQGQFAKQSDVLGVAASGMLVKRSVWQELHGLDPALPQVDAGLDFSVRARLAGYRVVIAPDARVAYDRKHNLFSKKGSPLTAIRRAQLHRRLSYAPLWLLPFLWVFMVPEALVRAVLLLLNKQPQRVIPEIVAALAAMFSFASVARSRKRFHRTKTLSIRSLDSLRQNVAESRRASALSREHYRTLRGRNYAPSQFMFGGGALTILILLGISIVAYGTFWSGSHLYGGGVSPLGSVSELWRTAIWHADVLQNPSDPFSIVLALLGSLTFWNPSFSLILLTILALPLAGLGVWLFVARLDTGQLTRSSVAFLWALSPMFLTALAEGRIGAIVFHILLPWLAFAAQAASRSMAAAGAAALLLLLAAASAPAAAPLLLICWVVLLVWQVKRSYRLILIPLPMAVAFAPLVLFHLAQGSVLSLLADPGLAVPFVPGQAWELALGLPEAGFIGWYAWLSALSNPALLAGIVLAVAYIPLGLGAVTSLLSKRFVLGASGLIVALMGYLATLIVSQLHLTNIGSEPLGIWPGSTLSLYWFGLVIAFGASVGRLKNGFVPGIAMLTALVAVTPLLLAPLLGTALAQPNGRVLPAIVTASAAEDPQLGTLVVHPQWDGAVRVELLRGAGVRIDQQQTINYVLGSVAEDELQAEFEQIAVNLISGIGDDSDRLAELDIRYVLLGHLPGESSGFALYSPPNAVEADAVTADFVTGLNSVFELQPVGDTSVGALWALAPEILAEAPALTEPPVVEPEGADRIWSYTFIGVLLLTLLLSLPSRRSAPAGVDAGRDRRDPDVGGSGPQPPSPSGPASGVERDSAVDHAHNSENQPEVLSAVGTGDGQAADGADAQSHEARVGTNTGSLRYFGEETDFNDLVDLDAEAAARDSEAGEYQPKRRKSLAVASQSVLALIAIGVAVVTVGGASLITIPKLDLNPSSAQAITPTADARQMVCPASFLNYGITQGSGEVNLQSIGTQPLRSIASMRVDDASNGLAQPTPLTETVVQSEYPGTSPLALTPPEGEVSGNLTYFAAQTQTLNTERIAGLIATDCTETRTEGWLVGGSTATGRTSVLNLVNPNPVGTTVEIIFYGDGGRQAATGLTIPANTMIAVALSSFAPDLGAPVVQVSSRGGPVAAFLGETVTRVLNSGGAEQVGFANPASTTQTIPLLQLRNQELVSDLASEGSINDARPALRLFNPNATSSDVRIELLNQSVAYDPEASDPDAQTPSGGTGLEGSSASRQIIEFTVAAQSSLEHYLPSLPDGNYSITVTSEQPMLIAARGSNPQRIETPNVNPNLAPRIEYRSDFDWAGAGSIHQGEQVLAIAQGPGAVLALTSRSTEATTVTLSGDAVRQYLDGSATASGVLVNMADRSVQLELAAGQQLVLPMVAGELRLAGLNDTLMAVGYSGGAQLGSYTTTDQRSAGEAIWVY